MVVAAAYGFERARVWATSDGNFPIESIRVVGNDIVSTDDIIEAAGLAHGANVITIDTERVRKRLESLPAIRAAKVSRRPPGEIRLQVRERTPWLLDNQTGELIDREGTRFEGNGVEGTLDLPLVFDRSGGSSSVSGLAEAFPPSRDWITENVAEIEIDERGNVALREMNHGFKALLGRPPYGVKAEHLRAVLQQWGAEKLIAYYEEIDLRFEGQAIARGPVATPEQE